MTQQWHNVHDAGACIPDSTDCVVNKDGPTVIHNMYFKCCDGVYRNGLRQDLVREGVVPIRVTNEGDAKWDTLQAAALESQKEIVMSKDGKRWRKYNLTNGSTVTDWTLSSRWKPTGVCLVVECTGVYSIQQ